MSKVFAKIPKSGLGNCLLVWAHAMVFAKQNKLELITGRWEKYRWGAILRQERKSRRYKAYFKETSLFKLFLFKIQLIFRKRITDPDLNLEILAGNVNYVFKKLSPDRVLFKYLQPHVELIKTKIEELLTPAVKAKFLKCTSPEIAIHIRRGDFKIANPITPNVYFINVIKKIREIKGKDLEVIVFTDAETEEVSDILKLPNIKLSQNKEDILDILQMSKSKYLILSESSTFSYWAAFLSDATVFIVQEDWQKKIKPDTDYYREIRISKDVNTKNLSQLLNDNQATNK